MAANNGWLNPHPLAPSRLLRPSRLDHAIHAHRERFGVPPDMFPLWNLGRWDELAVAIEAAVASGRPFNPLALAKAWGYEPPPGTAA
jgi:hypothetical protein